MWILRHLVPYRSLFFAVTFLLLGLGFYATYRRREHARRLDTVILWASTLLVSAVMGYSLYAEGILRF
jgi:multisubunit Na+/H+ antiporter MnhB subunit